MVDQYNSGKKTLCFNCPKRHPGCHNCKERQEEIELDRAAKAELVNNFKYTENFFRQQKRRQKKEMRRY